MNIILKWVCYKFHCRKIFFMVLFLGTLFGCGRPKIASHLLAADSAPLGYGRRMIFKMNDQPVSPVMPPYGVLFTYHRAPLISKFDRSSTPANSIFEKRPGTSETFYFGIPRVGGIYDIVSLSILSVSWGDLSLDAAAKNGRLNKIYYADYETYSVFTIFTRVRIYAYGD